MWLAGILLIFTIIIIIIEMLISNHAPELYCFILTLHVCTLKLVTA